MSLRMNLYGWNLQAFMQVLGSRNPAILEAAALQLVKSVHQEPMRSKAKAWLRTLLDDGFPLRAQRTPPSEREDGGLMTVLMETELHVFVTHSIVRAIASPDHLDFSGESSFWSRSAVGALSEDMALCGSLRSKTCGRAVGDWLSVMGNGSPLFGDDFLTSWSYYTVLVNQDLSSITKAVRAAVEFGREPPERLSGVPEDAAQRMRSALRDSSRQFLGDLMRWFGRIGQAGQDAFILWW